MIIRQGARATAEALLGREGFAKALQMKKDLKQSKKDGWKVLLNALLNKRNLHHHQRRNPKKRMLQSLDLA